MDSVKEGIRLNLVNLFNNSDKKRADLALACGVGRSAITNWCNGKGSIDIQHIPTICEFFGVSISEFFSEAEKLEKKLVLSPDEEEIIHMLRECDSDTVYETVKAFIRGYIHAIEDGC